ncbi:MAG: RNB domain-containing ribonuclease, partial [Tepidisphaeraceae bacterium]
NLAVLKSLTRAEYSPQREGHFALASKHYCHFTSPIRRYSDLTIHRLLDAYFAATGGRPVSRGGHRPKPTLEKVPSHENLVELGRHISFTERRAEDAERELRRVKVLSLLEARVGEEFDGVVTGITSFGIFVQIRAYLIDGLVRYEDLMDDWWDVDEKSGVVRGQRTGMRIGIGNVVKVRVARVSVPRRELDLSLNRIEGASGKPRHDAEAPKPKRDRGKARKHRRPDHRGHLKHPRERTKRGRRR